MHHDQIMESYTQLTPLNNYLNNCVIKLHIKLHGHQHYTNDTHTHTLSIDCLGPNDQHPCDYIFR